jgi:hypothetical protein
VLSQNGFMARYFFGRGVAEAGGRGSMETERRGVRRGRSKT